MARAMIRILFALLALSFVSPAIAQWQTPNHSVPLGRGTGTGFNSASPGASGLPLLSNGPSSDPSFQELQKSGNTHTFATTSGTLSNGHCVSIDSSGNFVDAGGTCTTSGGGGTVTSGTANQLAYYPSNGASVSGLTAGTNCFYYADSSGVPSCSTSALVPAPANSISNSVSVYSFGDSRTTNTSGASTASHTWIYYFVNDIGASLWRNFAVNGYGVADVNTTVFANLNPQDANNPIVPWFAGINDSSSYSTGTYPTTYAKIVYAQIARAAMSSTNLFLAGSSACTPSGFGTAETTFPYFNGLKSTTNGDTLTCSMTTTTGYIYVWYGMYRSSGGTFTITVNGSACTDSIGGASTIPSQPATLWFNGGASGTMVVGLARCAITATAPGGSAATVVVTNTASTGAGNPVTIFAVGSPPRVIDRGIGAPKVLMSGEIYQNADANSAVMTSINAKNQSIAQQLKADGLNVIFVDVRQYTNSTVDMSGTPINNCPASAFPGFHPNDCGMVHIAAAFEDACGCVSTQRGNINVLRNSSLIGFNGTVSTAVAATDNWCAEGIVVKPAGGNTACAAFAGNQKYSVQSLLFTGAAGITSMDIRFPIESTYGKLIASRGAIFQVHFHNYAATAKTVTLTTKRPTGGSNPNDWSSSTADLATVNLLNCPATSDCYLAYGLQVVSTAINGYEVVLTVPMSSGDQVEISDFELRPVAAVPNGIIFSPPPPMVPNLVSDQMFNSRYYQTIEAFGIMGAVQNATNVLAPFNVPVPMYAKPTVTATPVTTGCGGSIGSTITLTTTGNRTGLLNISGGSGMTAGQVCGLNNTFTFDSRIAGG